MAFTQSDLDAVNTAISSGELKIEVQGRLVIYRSVAELITARDLIKAELAAAEIANTAVRRGAYTVRFATSRE